MEICREIQDIIDKQDIRTLFQPIVNVVTGDIVGYEALSRGPQGSRYERPDNLFAAAHLCNLLWELEVLCRTRAIERACAQGLKSNLFLNVDPRIIHDPKFRVGVTIDLLKHLTITPQQIIFEVTEKAAITDYAMFREVLAHYVCQGYRVAIDDTGAGYSGLRTITEIRPQFIKLDMAIIRGVATDTLKQEVVRHMQALAKVTGMTLVAEGVETDSELTTLIGLGVHFVQGYLLGMPVEQLATRISSQAKAILQFNRRTQSSFVAVAAGGS